MTSIQACIFVPSPMQQPGYRRPLVHSLYPMHAVPILSRSPSSLSGITLSFLNQSPAFNASRLASKLSDRSESPCRHPHVFPQRRIALHPPSSQSSTEPAVGRKVIRHPRTSAISSPPYQPKQNIPRTSTTAASLPKHLQHHRSSRPPLPPPYTARAPRPPPSPETPSPPRH